MTNGTTYRFRVRAINDVGAGSYSKDNEMIRPLYIGTPDVASPVGAEIVRRGMLEGNGTCEDGDAPMSMHHR